jgi:hypothetical protein
MRGQYIINHFIFKLLSEVLDYISRLLEFSFGFTLEKTAFTTFTAGATILLLITCRGSLTSFSVRETGSFDLLIESNFTSSFSSAY